MPDLPKIIKEKNESVRAGMLSCEITYWTLQTMKLCSRQMELAPNTWATPRNFLTWSAKSAPSRGAQVPQKAPQWLLNASLLLHAQALAEHVQMLCQLYKPRVLTQSLPPRKECQAVKSSWSKGSEYLISNSSSCAIISYKGNEN